MLCLNETGDNLHGYEYCGQASKGYIRASNVPEMDLGPVVMGTFEDCKPIVTIACM